MTYKLEPDENCEQHGDHFTANAPQPWLRLIGELPKPGSWFRIAYSSSYLDHLVRPLIRFKGTDEWEVMRAPYFGRAEWIGFYPKEAAGILISPVNQVGPFRFKIESLAKVFLPSLYYRALRNDPKTALMSIGARMIDARKEMRQALMFARGGLPLSRYDEWRRKTYRPYDPDNMDASYSTPNVHIRYVTNCSDEQQVLKSDLWRSLTNQSFQDWSLAAISPSQNIVCNYSPGSKGIRKHVEGMGADSLLLDLKTQDLVTYAPLNSIVPDYALATLAQAAEQRRTINVFHGDSDAIYDDAHHSPRLLPDWSPRLQKTIGYLHEAAFFRVGSLEQSNLTPALLQPSTSFPENLSTTNIVHIRRILITNVHPNTEDEKQAFVGRKMPNDGASVDARRTISLIIPNKDRVDLLEKCLLSIEQFTTPMPDEVIIIDNGSSELTWKYYRSLSLQGLKVLASPGAFNFSKMCNIGAMAARGDILIFLNNDVEAIESDWLEPMVTLACQADVGVVGPLLLFPNRKIQHAGVVVGMGGLADHVFQGADETFSGYLKKLQSTHEVSAVTGAVMVIRKDRFTSIGGFDEDHFPVELNDIDLCLRLNKVGFQTLLCPQAKLIHHQSKTRGFQFKPFTRYALERRSFKRRRLMEIQDDSYYHPSLSLFSPRVSLDG